jgi:hypothetical protein
MELMVSSSLAIQSWVGGDLAISWRVGRVAASGLQVITCENDRRTKLFTSYAKKSQLEASASLEIAKHTPCSPAGLFWPSERSLRWPRRK